MAHKRITVLVGKAGMSGSEFVDTLDRYSDNEYILKAYSDIAVIIKDGVVQCVYLDDGSDVDDTDLVYFRGISSEPLRHVLAAYLSYRAVPIVNSESLTFQTMTKLEQYVHLAIAGIPVPDCLFVSKPEYYEAGLRILGASFPVVSKSVSGSNGNDNVLANNLEELMQVPFSDAIIQPFIPNNFDYRVIVAGDQVALAYKRIRDVTLGDYKNNIGQGGRREMIELPDELRQMAIKAARAIGREFAGLDIITDARNGKSVVLEINFNFGAPEFEDKQKERVYYEKVDRYLTSLVV